MVWIFRPETQQVYKLSSRHPAVHDGARCRKVQYAVADADAHRKTHQIVRKFIGPSCRPKFKWGDVARYTGPVPEPCWVLKASG